MSSRAIRAAALSPTLVSLALIFHIGAAAGADAQESARELLRGATTQTSDRQSAVASRVPSPQRGSIGAKPAVDAQESAKRLLLGVTTQTPSVPSPQLSKANGNRVRGDAQVHAQQVLLGRRDAPATGP